MARSADENRHDGGWDEIESWVFDLDNTLYPARCNLFAEVDRRMGEFISALLGVDAAEARRVQKHYYREFGTTLRGLMSRHGADPQAFLDYVHRIDLSPLDPDPELGAAIATLPGRKFVLTNGSRTHARNVLDRLGVAALFDGIFDIACADYVPKPAAEIYELFITTHAVEPARSVMFEDLARNLEAPHALGMRTVLVRSGTIEDDYIHDGVVPAADEPHVHHVTDDLAAFLRAAARARVRSG